MKRSMMIVLLIVVFVVMWELGSAQRQVGGEEAKSLQKISVDEIGKSVNLVGRLGVPLGKKMQISGYWHFPKVAAKDGSIRFTVTKVNEQQLAKPVEFNHEQLDFMDTEHHNVIPAFESHRELDGQEWALTAYETGEIRISPDEYREKAPLFPIAASPYYTQPFTSRIVGVLQRKAGRPIR
jgi:hypothetical protein